MFSAISTTRKAAIRLLALVFVLLAAACDPIGMQAGGPRVDTSKPVPVALLVPGAAGAGADSLLSQSLENAARLAMADLGDVTIDLRVYQTGADPAQAAAAASRAVDDGAKIILGPVFALAANAAGHAVASRGVNVLSFSNNPAIAGGNVFVLGPTFENAADRLVSYAVNHGQRNIMIVHGLNTEETIARDAITTAIARNGANLAGVASFELSQQGVINAVPQIARETRASGAQAVFFTSGTDGALPILTQLLSENGLKSDTTQFIGLKRWDIPATALALPGLQNGWFTVPDPGTSSSFSARYAAAYGSAPLPIAGLAYDGIAAIGALVKAGQADALTRQALTQGSGFVGVNGIFRLMADGTNQRGLAVAQIINNQVIVIDAAPRSFAGAGF